MPRTASPPGSRPRAGDGRHHSGRIWARVVAVTGAVRRSSWRGEQPPLIPDATGSFRFERKVLRSGVTNHHVRHRERLIGIGHLVQRTDSSLCCGGRDHCTRHPRALPYDPSYPSISVRRDQAARGDDPPRYTAHGADRRADQPAGHASRQADAGPARRPPATSRRVAFRPSPQLSVVRHRRARDLTPGQLSRRHRRS
jgi:hypothetical protein